jgi:hypothetical protein
MPDEPACSRTEVYETRAVALRTMTGFAGVVTSRPTGSFVLYGQSTHHRHQSVIIARARLEIAHGTGWNAQQPERSEASADRPRSRREGVEGSRGRSGTVSLA